MSALPAQRGSGRRGSIFHGVLLLVGPRQQLDFATRPIMKRVEVSGRLGLKSLGVDGKPLTLGTSIATRAGARRRHRPETRRENKLAVRPDSSRFTRQRIELRPTCQRWSMSDVSVQATISFIITFRKRTSLQDSRRRVACRSSRVGNGASSEVFARTKRFQF